MTIDVARALFWIVEQAQNGMGIARGCACTHGDDGGGLQMLNSIFSDIEINAAMALDDAIAMETQRAVTDFPKQVSSGRISADFAGDQTNEASKPR